MSEEKEIIEEKQEPITQDVAEVEAPEELAVPDDGVKSEYVDKLKKEAIKWRKKAQATLKEKEELSNGLTAAEEKAQEALSRIDALKQQTQDRLLNAKLEAEATKIGLLDMDCAKLADLSQVQIGEDGRVIGVEAALKTLKETKPYLFAAATTAQPFSSPRPVSEPKIKRAIDMSDEEAERAEKAYLAGLKRR